MLDKIMNHAIIQQDVSNFSLFRDVMHKKEKKNLKF